MIMPCWRCIEWLAARPDRHISSSTTQRAVKSGRYMCLGVRLDRKAQGEELENRHRVPLNPLHHAGIGDDTVVRPYLS